MKTKPIIFNDDMVRAILAGNKTQTRRIIKPQPGQVPGDDYVDGVWYCEDKYGDSHPIQRPYAVGDRLWVREGWCIDACGEDGIMVQYLADGHRSDDWLRIDEDMLDRLWEQSTHDCLEAGLVADESGRFYWTPDERPTRRRPSIFMPKIASRITLKVTHVRAEPLQDITEDDAAAEGIERHSGPYILDFARLWDSINAKRGYSWNSNPWVWVVEFSRVKNAQHAPRN